jgi:cytochrome b
LAGESLRIWDPVLRTLHWVTACLFVLNYWVLEPGSDWHQYLGYAMACVVVVRLVWGRFGPTHARFSLQALAPAHWREHVRELRARAIPPGSGHNPFGYLWLYASLGLFASLALSGFLLEEVDYFFGSDLLESLHGLFADTLFVLACIHVAAVILVGWWGRIELIRPMLTGMRRR